MTMTTLKEAGSAAIDVCAYYGAVQESMQLFSCTGDQLTQAGQRLIMAEVVGAIVEGFDLPMFVALPFKACRDLAYVLKRMGSIDVWGGKSDEQRLVIAPPRGVLYFGTPTIVDGAVLFPESVDEPTKWSVDYERATVRRLVKQARDAGYRRIVCGLGSGDVQLRDRQEDLGAEDTTIVAEKHFVLHGQTFTDWVIVKELR